MKSGDPAVLSDGDARIKEQPACHEEWHRVSEENPVRERDQEAG
jgi:hypothetical protein